MKSSKDTDSASQSGSNVVNGIEAFVLSAAIVFLVTGLAKVASALGHSAVLNVDDPIFHISFHYLLLSAGLFELAISAICLSRHAPCRLRTTLVAWWATSILAYRFCLWLVNWKEPCRCLGTLTQVLHIQPQVADKAMLLILIYLVLGSYAVLFYYLRFDSLV